MVCTRLWEHLIGRLGESIERETWAPVVYFLCAGGPDMPHWRVMALCIAAWDDGNARGGKW